MENTARSPWLPSVVITAVVMSACAVTASAPPSARPTEPTSVSTSVPVPTTTTTTAPPTPTTATTVPPSPPQAIVRPCHLPQTTSAPFGGEAITASVDLIHALICASTDVVVAAPREGRHAAQVAAAIEAPLVFASAETPYDPAPLGAARAWTTDSSLVVPGDHSILPLPDETAPLPEMLSSIDAEGVTSEHVRSSIQSAVPSDTLMVVSRERPEMAAVATVAAELVDGTVVWAQPGDMRRRRGLAPLAEVSESRFLIGNFGGSASWQMDVLASGRQLPGGGQVLFPGKRLVALYGHPHTPGLGALGEQTAEEAVARAAELAGPYGDDDVTVVPTFEIIATTATAGPGADGDYSDELTVEELRPWVEAAGDAGYYVVLDLQPGRTDFLTQAKRYEELLRLPHVGLALDPEWRLGRNQVHLRQVGSVTAGEVNTVVRWLADLVREQRLPQKLLLLHQFKLSMIQDRHLVETPAELAVVIQMDGQGPLGTKYDTWQALQDADDRTWLWGWKNFFDEDSPTAHPNQVLDLRPDPVFVSYQ